MERKRFEPLGVIDATREADGQPVQVKVLREVVTVTWVDGTISRAEGRRVFMLGVAVLRVDGADPAYLTDGRTRYKLSHPL